MTRKSAKVVKKALAKRDAAKTPRKAVPNPTEPPKLLSGGNPQIAKGYADAPVQAYIAAMPGLKLGTVCGTPCRAPHDGHTSACGG
jgi:hypothetical protein